MMPSRLLLSLCAVIIGCVVAKAPVEAVESQPTVLEPDRTLIRREALEADSHHVSVIMHRHISHGAKPHAVELTGSEDVVVQSQVPPPTSLNFSSNPNVSVAYVTYTMSAPTWDDVQASAASAHFLTVWGLPLIMAVFFVMSNSADDSVRMMSFKLLSGSVSLGCTALLFQAFKVGWYMAFGQLEYYFGLHCAIDLCKLLFMMWLFPLVLRSSWSQPIRREALTQTGAHWIGFFGIQFSNSLLLNLFSSSPGNCFGGMVAIIVMFLTLVIGARYYRWILLKHWREDEASWKPWMVQCDRLENEAMGLLFGYLLSLNIRFWIVGIMPGMPGYPPINTAEQVDIILLTTIPVGGLAVAFVGMCKRYRSALEQRPLLKRLADTGKHAITFSAGWLLFYFAQWQSYFLVLTPGVYGTLSDNISGSVMTFLVGAFLATWFIYLQGLISHAFNWSRDEVVLQELCTGFIPLLGFGWETTMSIAIQGVAGQNSNSFKSSTMSDELSSDFLFFVLLILVVASVFPIWGLHMLPKCIGSLEDDARTQPEEDARKQPQEAARKQPQEEARKQPQEDARKQPHEDARKQPHDDARKQPHEDARKQDAQTPVATNPPKAEAAPEDDEF